MQSTSSLVFAKVSLRYRDGNYHNDVDDDIDGDDDGNDDGNSDGDGDIDGDDGDGNGDGASADDGDDGDDIDNGNNGDGDDKAPNAQFPHPPSLLIIFRNHIQFFKSINDNNTKSTRKEQKIFERRSRYVTDFLI